VKLRILQSVAPLILVISFTPVLGWAQAEINPDHFDSPSNATTVAHKATLNRNQSPGEDSIFVPRDVQCAGVTLTRGYYSLSIRQLGRRDVVRLTPMANGVPAPAIEVRATPRLTPGAPSKLIVDGNNRRQTLTAISLEKPGVTLYLETTKERGASMDTRLIPMSSSGSRALTAGGN
jgi:hypothetical protein